MLPLKVAKTPPAQDVAGCDHGIPPVLNTIPISNGTHSMAMKLPEPEYYELAELVKRWNVSESYLFRLGAEGKLRFAWPIPDNLWVWVTSDSDHPDTVENVENLFPSLPPRHLCIRVARKAKKGLEGHEISFFEHSRPRVVHEIWRKIKADKIEISVSGMAVLSQKSLQGWDEEIRGLDDGVFESISHFTGAENRIFELPDERSLWMYEVRESITTCGGLLPPLPEGYYFETASLITVDELVVLSSEVRRIESHHVEAEKAASDDVLSGSAQNSRRILLTVINALCEKANIDPKGRDATSKIMRLLELQGTPAAERTIRDAIKDIPESMRYRKGK
ncbi:MAG: hypothetical protein JJ714_02140 [Acidithiobacillus sp.]|nr:hypothetical protein [Acidithiobacillus sp.]